MKRGRPSFREQAALDIEKALREYALIVYKEDETRAAQLVELADWAGTTLHWELGASSRAHAKAYNRRKK